MRTDFLKSRFGDRLKEGEPLAKHVNFRIGGPADFYLEAKNSAELEGAVAAALQDGAPFVVIGGGSNTLPSDGGFRGLVIQAANRGWSIDGDRVYAEAGVPSAFLARKAADAGLTGLEWAVSLPGTIGGAVRGNAGCFGGETKDVLASVDALRIDDGNVSRVVYSPEECRFAYRESAFKHNHDVVLAVELELVPAPKEECLAKIDAVLAQRKLEQPTDNPSAGCLFKNFDYQDDSELKKLKTRVDVPAEFLARKRIPAGWLIDQADLKGASIGAARVSEKHANFLVNTGGATASDIVQLMSRIKTRIRDEFGIQLQEEVQLL
jgi:UDP-N-acetylmuramate dehydrogenase